MTKVLPSLSVNPSNNQLFWKAVRFATTNTYPIRRPDQDAGGMLKTTTLVARVILKAVWVALFPFRIVFLVAKLLFQRWRHINALRLNLTSHGLEERSLIDLELLSKSRWSKTRMLASWNLAWWYANQLNKESAEKALGYLKTYFQYEVDPVKIGRALVLQAESASISKAPYAKESAEALKQHMKEYGENANFYLALSNVATRQKEKLEYVNKALELSSIAPLTIKPGKGTLYDRLVTIEEQPLSNTRGTAPLVTVIIPAYNAAGTIHTAIESMQAQTWPNLEIIIADDCSTDATKKIALSYAKKDTRIKVVQTKKNSGPYVARNEALKVATGEFITCNDSDDWSHPEKVERQATHLIENSHVMANTSELARAYEDLGFYRRGLPGMYIQINMSSLMFRREPVLEKLGSWDSVRFGADSEFIKRLRIVFGKHALVELKNALYSFLRQSDGSLTGSSAFGYHGFMMGARREYAESQAYHHRHTSSVYYEFPMKERPFAVPYPMLPERVKSSTSRHVDAVIAGDFRDHATAKRAAALIKDLSSADTVIGLVSLYTFMKHGHSAMDHHVRELIDGQNVQSIVYGESVACKTLFLLNPASLKERQQYVPTVTAAKGIVDNPTGPVIKTAGIYFNVKKWESATGR